MSNKEKEIINVLPIELKQTGVIDYSGLDIIISNVKKEIEALDLDNIEATEENKGKLRKLRTRFNKEKYEYEDARLEIRRAIERPYNEFKEKYDELFNLYEENVDLLRNKINLIEDKQREDKRKELEEYFKEVIIDTTASFKENNIDLDFVKFEDLELNITISASMASLKKTINEKIKAIATDLIAISTNENKVRLLAKYQENLDLSKSLLEVQQELKREEEIINNAKPIEKVEEEVEEKVEKDHNVNVVEKVYKVSFILEDTKENIRKVREFMKDNNINYIVK